MRLFIAIPTTKEVNKKIEEELSKIKPKLKGKDVRYLSPKKWHFTITFLGEQKESKVATINESIENVVKTFEPIEIRLDKIKHMPPVRNPRMIWATTDEDSSRRLEALKGKIDKEMRRQGIKWDRSQRSYKGHITLARFNIDVGSSLSDINHKMDIKFKTPSVQLMKSELKPEGAEYTTLKEFEL